MVTTQRDFKIPLLYSNIKLMPATLVKCMSFDLITTLNGTCLSIPVPLGNILYDLFAK